MHTLLEKAKETEKLLFKLIKLEENFKRIHFTSNKYVVTE